MNKITLDEDIAMTLYDRILELVIGSDPSAGLTPVFNTEETMFVMAQDGIVLNGADYVNPYSRSNTNGDLRATVNIANIVDDIPQINPVFSPTARKVSNVYMNIVNGVHVTEPQPSPEIQEARDRIKAIIENEDGSCTQLAAQEYDAHKSYNEAYNNYIDEWVKYQADPDLRNLWPVVGPTKLDKVNRAFEAWGAAGRDQVKSARAQLATLNEGQIARCFADAQAKLVFYQLGDGLGGTFLPAIVNTSDWASSDTSLWPEHNFSESNITSNHSESAKEWNGSAGLRYGIWNFGGGGGSTQSRESLSSETTDIQVSFKSKICPIYRPWIDTTLFKLKSWDVGTFAGPGDIAGGPDPLMPLIPIALLLVRDVKITANWREEDRTRFETATQGAGRAGWSIFRLSGNYNRTSTNERIQNQTLNDGFFIPDIQVVGWVCYKVPFCPPSSQI